MRYTCTVYRRGPAGRVYVILTLPKPDDMSYDSYLEQRRYQLITYCEGCVAKLPWVQEVLGIAMEPYATKTVSVDYMLIAPKNGERWAESVPAILQKLEEEKMWRPETMKVRCVVNHELPQTSSKLTRAVANLIGKLFQK